MKHICKTTIAFAMMMSLSCGCNKFSFEYGESVGFKASTGHATRADYSGAIDDNIERIDWEDGDKIRIASAEVSAPASKFSDYLVTDITTNGRYSNAKITVSSDYDPIGLRWGNAQDHHFYAVYPSPLMGGVTKTQDFNVVTGEILASQPVESISGTAAAKVAKPSFDASMMMVSSKTVNKNSTSRDVSLDFQPVTTAIQFTITNKTGDEMTTCKVALSSKTHPLSGPFSCNVATGASTFTGTLNDCKTVCLSFDEPVVTPVDGTLTFTMFLNPADDPDDLTLSVYEESNKCRFTDLKMADNTPVVFNSGIKTLVSGIFVPAGAVWKVKQNSKLLSWTDGTVKNVDIE
ncbi:MAG: fimbrillin family protein [Bacteroidales bacterium]|nr:fimbrillin family protein [Bacteroidales bacterium]